MKQAPAGRPEARGRRVLLLRAAFNAHVVEGLAAGARAAFFEWGGREADLEEVVVPGAFELPAAARAAALSGRYDALVALGAVIRGETDHYEHVARAAASGLASVALETLVPLGFGVLTVGAERQALERAAPGPDNKGAEALRAALDMAAVLPRLRRRGRVARPGRSRRR